MHFFYLRDFNSKQAFKSARQIGCIAYDFSKETNTVRYHFSVCHPSDVFNKVNAKKIAAGRMQSKPFEVQNTSNVELTPTSALKLVMKHIKDSNNASSINYKVGGVKNEHAKHANYGTSFSAMMSARKWLNTNVEKE